MSKAYRSYLFVPANRVERFEKALDTEADAVIIDLEDAVPANLKIAARTTLIQWLNDHPQHTVIVRINARDTAWFKDDIQLARFNNVSAIVLPKTEHPEDLLPIKAVADLDIYPLIETAQGLANVRTIAQSSQVKALMFGSIDFQLDLDMQAGYTELLYFRNEIVLASKLAQIEAPIDGVTVDFQDLTQLQQETTQAKNLGFAGKLCIHPKQVATVNQTFSPSEDEITWAKQVLQAVNQAQHQAVSLNGKMIDLPVVLKAEKILKQAASKQVHQRTLGSPNTANKDS